MPEIIYGRNHSRREELFFARIKESAQEGETLVIVPDQYSFEFDKRLYEYLGARLFNDVQTAGVSRLCDKICRSLGGRTLENADGNMKLIAMYRAQARLRSEGKIRFYRRSLLRPSFVTDCISLVSQLVRAGASPETVRIAAERTAIGGAKLFDIALIFSAYNEALSELGLRDSISETAQAAALAKEHRYFSGKRVFFDAFTNFSADELLLVGSVIGCCKKAVFSLICDECGDGSNPFAETVRTRRSIERISLDCNLKVKMTRADGLDQTEPLAHINENLWKYKTVKQPSHGMVKVVSAADLYEESEYVCAEICRLVRGGARYNDIAVICGGLEETAQILSGVAERYEIPYFIDLKRSALTSVPAKYLMSVLDAALTREYRTENILRIVKSPLSAIFDYDACDLEDFCIKWRVEGDMWKRPFKLNGQSERIDETRRRIIEPLERFRSACADATAGEMCSALFSLLDELEMSKQVYSAVRAASSENETELEISRGFKQVWLGIVGAVKTVYENMRGEKMSLRAFSELLRLMLDSIKISAPPQKSDCVRFAEAGRSRISGVKTLFIMQANDGVFPHGASVSGLLGENELAALTDLGAELDSSARIQLDGERMSVYLAVTSPSERLYVCYSEADRTGSMCVPSQLCGMVSALFEDDISLRAAELGQEFYCTSYRTAFYNYLEHSKDKSQENANVRQSLRNSPQYETRLEYVRSAAAARDESVSAETAKALFFPKDMNLSATRVSDYYKCPYSYFCKYGLRLSSPNTVDMTPQYTGNLVHSCLERVMSREENGKRVYNEEFTRLTDEQLFEMIDRRADEYVAEEMGGAFGKTLSFKYAIERLKKSVFSMAVNFREELKSSLFLPVAFEYDLTDKDGNSILAVQLGDTRIQLRGLVDRADIYHTDEGAWLRIVDYKTGRQRFREEEVYHGLDLQMLIYLLAATMGNSSLGGGEKLRPAGIMYSLIQFVPPSLSPAEVRELEENGGLEERLRLECSKKYKPDGVMLGEEIFPALNTANEGVYTVFRLTKSGKLHGSSPVQPVSEERLKAMELFALGKVKEMAERLRGGDIKADPIQTANGIPCTYCDYRAMCADPLPKNPRTVSKDDRMKLDGELEKIIREGKADGGKMD